MSKLGCVRLDAVGAALLAALLAGAATSARAAERLDSPFRYVGGTEKLETDCAGKLEVTSSALVFTCPAQPVAMPFDSIVLMQFRPDISRHVRHLKLRWRVKPFLGGGKKNRFFTVIYRAEGDLHGVVFKVDPEFMRPYLAEIELKSGKRVEVKGYEDFQ